MKNLEKLVKVVSFVAIGTLCIVVLIDVLKNGSNLL